MASLEDLASRIESALARADKALIAGQDRDRSDASKTGDAGTGSAPGDDEARERVQAERDEALRERDEAVKARSLAERERDEARVERDKAITERDEALRKSSDTAEPDPDPDSDSGRDAELTEARREIDALRARLEDERSGHEREVARIRAEIAASGPESCNPAQTDGDGAAGPGSPNDSAIDRLDRSVTQVKHVNDVLRGVNATLRAAKESGKPDSNAEIAGLRSELEGLRAVREADAATVAALVERLETLVAEARAKAGEAA